MRLKLAIVTALSLAGLLACSVESNLAPGAPSRASIPSASAAWSPQGNAGKVSVCHRDDAAYRLLSINGNALEAHLGHGDGQPDGAVPGAPGFTFNATCAVVPPAEGCSGSQPSCATVGVCTGHTIPVVCVNNEWKCDYSQVPSIELDPQGNLLPYEFQCSDSKDNNCNGTIDLDCV